MIIPDVNLLLYATNRDAVHHRAARDWWARALSEAEPVGLSWIVILGFIRISTNSRLMRSPLDAPRATALVDEWLARPPARLILETERHWDIFKRLLLPLGTAGNLTSDAHLAALAISHGATLCSTDNDFGRFVGLAWENPLGTR